MEFQALVIQDLTWIFGHPVELYDRPGFECRDDVCRQVDTVEKILSVVSRNSREASVGYISHIRVAAHDRISVAEVLTLGSCPRQIGLHQHDCKH